MVIDLHIDQNHLLDRAQRINVVGNSGVGKSTFARQLADIKGIPYVQMDQLFWNADWQESTDEAFFSKLEGALAAESWVLDGNYTRSIPIKWERTEVVVFLDLPFYQNLSQILRRSYRRAVSGEELWPGTGNTETFSRALLSKESIILWSINNHKVNRQRYLDPNHFTDFPHIQLLHLSSRQAIEGCLRQARDTLQR